MTVKTEQTNPMMETVKELRESASEIRKRASKLESLAKVLDKIGIGEFIVIEDIDINEIPIQMGTYEGIDHTPDRLSIKLGSHAYIFKDRESGDFAEYKLCKGGVIGLWHNTITRSLHGFFIPQIYRGRSADKILRKYGHSIESYKALYTG